MSERVAAAGAVSAADEKMPGRTPSTRVRLLGWYMVLLAFALVAGLVIQRSILLDQLDDDVNAQLRQEVEELQQLTTGRNPATGEPFGSDVQAIFETFLGRNVPIEGEALFTLIDGRPHASTVTPLQLLDDPVIVAEWAAVTEPRQAELSTSEGVVRYLAVPVIPESGVAGTFVVAIFLEPRRANVTEVLQTGGLVFGSVFVVASVFAWFAAGHFLRPVRLLTETASSITDEQFSRRIPVNGNDEIAQLSMTFNAMLDRLEEAFQTQRRFIDDASHELKTPITIIRGHLEVMDGGASAEREETKRLVLDELERMSRMVEDLLLLARSEHRDFLDLHPIDVPDFMEEVVAKAEGLSTERHWVLESAAPAVIEADRQRLTQALMNLARNAMQHSEAGTTVAMAAVVTGDSLVMQVRDEGAGISVADQQRIFDRFSRGRERRGDGSGLGLAIVKTIAEAHGGSVHVRSAVGMGSTFEIVLPLPPMEVDPA